MSSLPATIDPSKPARDIATFGPFLKSRLPSIKQVAASHMTPERIYRIVLACVSQTPALRDCSMESIFRATLKAAELGLEPGSALGEAYLVPFGKECTLIPGYRGLIALAYRSGHVRSVDAHCVYQGDEFDFELGLTPKLRHVPKFDGKREPDLITFAYCVVQLTQGGVVYDVMTRSEIDAIRKRSRASSSGPWVTDFAEMARKTVARRTLKYCPMSVEMSKAFAQDAAAETGQIVDADFEAFDDIADGNGQTKTDKVKGKVPEGDLGQAIDTALATGPKKEPESQEALV